MRGMEKSLGAAVLLVGALLGLGVSSAASAQTTDCAPTQDPNICVKVSAPAVVNTSTFWAIAVEIQNNAASTLNRVRFNADLMPWANLADPIYFVDPVTGQAPANPTYPYAYLTTTNPVISCWLDSETHVRCGGDTASLQPGEKFSFTVMSNAPSTTGTLSLSWDAAFAEGNSSSGSSNSATVTGTETTEVTAPNQNAAAGSFPATGGTLATEPDNAFTTRITIPQTGKTSNASIQETQSSDPRCNSFRTCYTSDITILDFQATPEDPLKIVLHMAEANIRKGVKIENVSIYYTYFDGSNLVEAKVDPCPFPDRPRGDGIPCLNKMVNYKNMKSSPSEWTTPIGFGFYWQLLNTVNGRYNLW